MQRILVKWDDDRVVDGKGAGLAHICVSFLRANGQDAHVFDSLAPHPFAVQAMLEVGEELRDLVVLEEFADDDLLVDLDDFELDNPLEDYEELYNEERIHRFRSARERIAQMVSDGEII